MSNPVPSSSSSSNLTRGRLLRLRLRAWDRAALGAWLFILGLAELRGAAAAVRDHLWVLAAITPAFVAVFTALAMLASTFNRNRNMRLDEVSPEAIRTIREALAAAGLRAPDRLMIAPMGATSARFHGFSGRRATLYLALPQLLALSAADLPVLAATAMAVCDVTAYPTAAQRLWHKRGSLELQYIKLERQGRAATRKGRRIAAFLAATESFAHDVKLRENQAAVTVAGSADAAARVLYSERTINIDFYQYLARFGRLIARKRRVPASVYAGWFAEWAAAPKWLQTETLCPVEPFREEQSGFGAFDSDGFPGYISGLRAGRAGLPAQSTISPRMAKRLAVIAAKRFTTGSNNARTVDGEKIALAYVYTEAPEDAEILEAAADVLERPANRVDVVEILRSGRGDELAAALLDPDLVDYEDPDGGLNRARVFAMLLVSALIERGMLRLDAYREWHFTGPDGQVVDVAQVVDEALPPHDRPDRLCTLLRG